MTGTRTDVLSQPRSERGGTQPRSPAVLPGVIAVEGAALAVLAGLDGSPVWRVARVLVVVAITALAVWFTGRTGRAARGGIALVPCPMAARPSVPRCHGSSNANAIKNAIRVAAEYADRKINKRIEEEIASTRVASAQA